MLAAGLGVFVFLSTCVQGAPAPADAKRPHEDTRSEADERAADRAVVAYCRKGKFQIDEFFKDPTAVSALGAARAPGLFVRLSEYAACRDLHGAPEPCRALASVGEMGDVCAGMAWEARMVRSRGKESDLLPLCLRSPFAKGMSAAALRRVCTAYVSGITHDNPQAVCRALSQEGVKAAACPAEQAFWTGRKKECSAVSDRYLRAECEELADYAAGLRDAGTCRKSPLCSADCSGYATRLSREFCANASRYSSATQKIVEFGKNQPMKLDPLVRKNMDRIERGLPPLPMRKSADSGGGDGNTGGGESDGDQKN